MRAWIGKAIAIIGIIHTIYGFVDYRATFAEIIDRGIINTINGEPLRDLAFWFVYFGLTIIVFGLFVDWCERKFNALPRFLGWSLLALTIIIVTMMPNSGGWAFFIPSLGAIYRQYKTVE